MTIAFEESLRRLMSLLQNTRALVQIIRPELPAAADVCVVLGPAVSLGALPSISRLLGFCLGFFLPSSAMVFIDYFDLEVERMNVPNDRCLLACFSV